MRRPPRSTRFVRRFLGFLPWLPLLACGPSNPMQNYRVDPPEAVPEIQGVNWTGDAFATSGLEEKFAVVFFGFASCPDVCPGTLSRLKQVVAAPGLAGRRDEVAVVFVSVDPETDTPEKLAKFIPTFDRRFYGVHVEPDALREVVEGYSVAVGRATGAADPDASIVHSGTMFVVDPKGKLRMRFSQSLAATQMAMGLEQLLEEDRQRRDLQRPDL